MKGQRITRRARLEANLLRHGASLERQQPPRILSYKSRPGSAPRGRALLAYISTAIVDEMMGVPAPAFSNYGIARAWVDVLTRLGYEVDIINWDDQDFVPTQQYELFVGHGAKNFNQLYGQLSPRPKTVYFSSGSYWKFHNQQELARFEYFKQRHHKELPLDRYINESEEQANREADAIICLGNQDLAATYKDFSQVYALPIATLPQPHRIAKDYAQGADGFLFFSGGGNIHKGLDLLLDAFVGSQLHLYIGTRLDPEFEQYYHDALHNQPNIHYEGYVDINSDKFHQLTTRCNYVILPSCSEGSPGSVVDCMQQGLIPVITKTAHLDVLPYGVVLADDRVETIKKTIARLSGLPLSEQAQRGKQMRAQAGGEHSPLEFQSNLLTIMTKIIGEKA